jgi:hypothetical protein
VPTIIADYERICRRDGIELVSTKCKAYWLAYAQAIRAGITYLQQWLAAHQPVVAAVADAVQIAAEHITVLGSAVGGDYAAELAVDADGSIPVNQPQASPLAARARRASKPSRGLTAMAEGQLAAGGKQPSWTVMRDCLANALSYDARVCNSQHYGPFVKRLQVEIVQVASAPRRSEGVPSPHEGNDCQGRLR